MFKKIAITVSLGALSLTGCSAASTVGTAGTAGPGTAGGPTSSSSAAPGSPATSAASTAGTTGTAPATAPTSAPAGPVVPHTPAPEASAAETPTTDAPVTPPAPAAPTGDGVQAAAAFGWGAVLAGDEFSYSGAPDVTNWSALDGPGHAGKGARSPQAWSVSNGVATVKGDAAGTTGGMSAKFGQQKYGRWETRMKTNARDANYHPVLLLWPNNNTSPNCAEVDFAEGTSGTAAMNFYLHYECSGGDVRTTAATPIDPTQWHNYAVEWTPAGITGYIDGIKTFTDSVPAHQPTVGMHQTMQLDWFPGGTGTSPAQMDIDWVRVYQ